MQGASIKICEWEAGGFGRLLIQKLRGLLYVMQSRKRGFTFDLAVEISRKGAGA